MSALRTALADRKHDLPPLWDGQRVEWGEWEGPLWTTAVLHLPLRDLACRKCGSLAGCATNRGRVAPPEGTAALHGRWLHVSRCFDCGHDTVFDLVTDESWDLDPSDYGDEGSWDPEKAQGTLF